MANYTKESSRKLHYSLIYQFTSCISYFDQCTLINRPLFICPAPLILAQDNQLSSQFSLDTDASRTLSYITRVGFIFTLFLSILSLSYTLVALFNKKIRLNVLTNFLSISSCHVHSISRSWNSCCFFS